MRPGISLVAAVSKNKKESVEKPSHIVWDSCNGEQCGICYRLGSKTKATHKVSQEDPHTTSDGFKFHPLTQYLCCYHFCYVMGDWARDNICFPTPPPAA